jgi:alcohol dehydrogenase (cytochrome c)
VEKPRRGAARWRSPWLPGVYDPSRTSTSSAAGNLTPAYTSQTRGEGDNLFTCAIVALDVDTGKMEWYTRRRRTTRTTGTRAQTPVLVDGDFRGSGPRKMVLTASRNGYYSRSIAGPASTW